MTIDFSEIPQANKGGGQQDHFELFGRDFLKTIGYKILRHPDRGADGKKDLIVSETRIGVGGETTINWLVSCKHYAHSGKSVTDTDEQDIIDRVNAHNCQGFMGLYSTLPSSSLSNKLFGYNDKIHHIIYDFARIEEKILSNKQNEQLFLRYFPKSFDKYCQQKKNAQNSYESEEDKTFTTSMTEEDFLRINKTAIIIIEIEKIKEKYWEADWDRRNEIIKRLNKYADHSNVRLAEDIFLFFSDIASMTRSRMTYNSANSLYWNVLNFFPGLHNEKDLKGRIQIAKDCIHLGQNIAYDAFIHLRNLAIAMLGLTTIKFIYRSAKQSKIEELIIKVNSTYDELEDTLRRPERNDLGNAQELAKIFRADLDEWDLGFPTLPNNLQTIVDMDEKK